MKKTYLLSNGRNWFFRFSDSSFQSKFSGLNSASKHFIDYFAFRIGDKWLDLNNQKKFDSLNSKAVHEYSLDSAKIKEEIYFSPHLCVDLDIEGKEEIKEIFLEIGVNIREWNENFHFRDYNVSFDKKGVIIKNSEKGKVFLKCNKEISVEKYFYKNHFPGNLTRAYNFDEQEQRCLVVLIKILINSKKEEILFDFSDLEINERENVVKQDLVRKYYFDNLGFTAGFPYFVNLWTRDFCLCSPYLMEMGFTNEVRETLAILAKHQKNGNVPSFVGTDVIYDSIDSNPYFIISACLYSLKTNSKEFYTAIENAVKTYSSSDIFVCTDDVEKKTWMDSVDRTGCPIEVQALWAEAFYLYSKLSYTASYFEKGKKIENAIFKQFKNGDYYLDTFSPNRKMRTINPLFLPFILDISKKKAVEIIEKIEEEFLTPQGVLCYSPKNPDFDANSYHKGAVWLFLTNILILCELKYNRNAKAREIYDLQKKNMFFRCINGSDEIYVKSGFGGSISQLWSDVLFLYAEAKLKEKYLIE